MDKRIETLQNFGCDIKGALKRSLDDEVFYIECLKTIPDDENFELLDKALADGNIKAAFDYAHALKGVLANLGLTNMFKKTEEIVEPLRNGKIDGMKEKFNELTELKNQLRVILNDND